MQNWHEVERESPWMPGLNYSFLKHASRQHPFLNSTLLFFLIQIFKLLGRPSVKECALALDIFCTPLPPPLYEQTSRAKAHFLRIASLFLDWSFSAAIHWRWLQHYRPEWPALTGGTCSQSKFHDISAYTFPLLPPSLPQRAMLKSNLLF